MYSLIRSLLFHLDAERSHRIALRVLDYLPSVCFPKPKLNVVHAMGLEFRHPIGLAAGFDKNGEHLESLAKLGFSFIELGTVTPRPQLGNPKPRLFRLPEAEAIINRMGFNNHGVDALVHRVKNVDYSGIIGINIGKNKDTPILKAVDDYLYCLRKVYSCASYVTINVSSPNTPHLRELQKIDLFKELLNDLREEQLELADLHQRYVPLVIKLSPDETDESLKRMADVVVSLGLDGIIATNTTSAREGIHPCVNSHEEGGLSGRPLANQSTHCLKVLKQVVGEQVTLIGVGGIDHPDVAIDKLNAGAHLLQVYTGLIYQGPGLIKRLVDEISNARSIVQKSGNCSPL